MTRAVVLRLLAHATMRSDRIELKNFRGFEAFLQKLVPEINVIVAERATAKTVLLNALATKVGSFSLGVDGVPRHAIRRDDVRRMTLKAGHTTDAAQGRRDDMGLVTCVESPDHFAVPTFGGQQDKALTPRESAMLLATGNTAGQVERLMGRRFDTMRRNERRGHVCAA